MTEQYNKYNSPNNTYNNSVFLFISHFSSLFLWPIKLSMDSMTANSIQWFMNVKDDQWRPTITFFFCNHVFRALKHFVETANFSNWTFPTTKIFSLIKHWIISCGNAPNSNCTLLIYFKPDPMVEVIISDMLFHYWSINCALNSYGI